MITLAKLTIGAHGGIDRWEQFESVSAKLRQGGALWQLKGHPDTLTETGVTVGLRTEWASHFPFGAGGRRSRFEPGRVALEAGDGTVLEELRDPRPSFAGHVLETPWSDLQLAYFVGCAMWTYLNMPFLLAWPGVRCEELSPWKENGESWRRLGVTFPGSVATHSSRQTLYIDELGHVKRHDYDVEISGGTPAVHYIDTYVDVSGIKFPTAHRIFPRQADGSANRELLVVSIDVSGIELR